ELRSAGARHRAWANGTGAPEWGGSSACLADERRALEPDELDERAGERDENDAEAENGEYESPLHWHLDGEAGRVLPSLRSAGGDPEGRRRRARHDGGRNRTGERPGRVRHGRARDQRRARRARPLDDRSLPLARR